VAVPTRVSINTAWSLAAMPSAFVMDIVPAKQIPAVPGTAIVAKFAASNGRLEPLADAPMEVTYAPTTTVPDVAVAI
jgi:hypothetical protein